MAALIRARRTRVRKEASPEQLGWRARLSAAEPEVVASFLTWVEALRAALSDVQLLHMAASRTLDAFDLAVQAVMFHPAVAPVAGREASRSFEEIVQSIDPELRMSFDVHDPNFDTAVRDHEARLVREVTGETRRAIVNIIERGYRDGHPPADIAKDIRQLVGLTSRQAQAVINFQNAQVEHGATPQQVVDRSMRYANRMRTNRARLIARTETARAQTSGRLEGWKQAASRGLFSYGTAEMEWSSVQTDKTEICGELNGTRVPLGTTWPGGLLPGSAHPGCRCAPILRLPAREPAWRSPLVLVKTFNPDEPRDDHGRWFGSHIPHIGFHSVTPREFEEAKRGNSRDWNLAPKSAGDYEDADVRLSADHKTGYLVKGDNLQNVFNNSKVKRAGVAAVIDAVQRGAKTLDCYDGFLPGYYSRLGFVEVARMKFAPAYAPAGMNADVRATTPDVVFMVYRGGDPATLPSRIGTFQHVRTTEYVDDYSDGQQRAHRSA